MRTLSILLAGALLGLSLAVWSVTRVDTCSAHLAGLPGPSTQIVGQGRQSVEVPCEQWFPRQPIGAQAALFGCCSLGLTSLVSLGIDLVRWRSPRRSLNAELD